MTAAEKWARDEARKVSLERLGHTLVIFWEKQIRNAPHEVEQALRKLIGVEERGDVPSTE